MPHAHRRTYDLRNDSRVHIHRGDTTYDAIRWSYDGYVGYVRLRFIRFVTFVERSADRRV